jgi:hypothetical protein
MTNEHENEDSQQQLEEVRNMERSQREAKWRISGEKWTGLIQILIKGQA